jgi:hypothetical protein
VESILRLQIQAIGRRPKLRWLAEEAKASNHYAEINWIHNMGHYALQAHRPAPSPFLTLLKGPCN